MARAFDFGQTGLWTRINALNSPWALDDILEIVPAVGNKLDVIMLPKVEGPGHPLFSTSCWRSSKRRPALRAPSSSTPFSRRPKA